MAMLIDYAAHFWGDKCIGYNVLYDNMKKGEDAVQELVNFLKERINMEDDILKCLGKSLNRTNSHISNTGSFVDAWGLTKGTLELWTEIQTTMLRNLNELSKEVTRYQEELTKVRKRAKDIETLEAINLMQTTTTCLQKAKETYNHRCAEAMQLKNSNKEWNAASTKEYLKVRHKLNKAHDEYRQYMDKYTQIRDIYEMKILRAAHSFQEHDRAHLLQMKKFFVQLAKHLEDGHNAQAQVSTDLRQNMEHIDVEEIMLHFIEEKGTGMELPQKLNWTEADELPSDLDIISGVHSQSSSNSSAIVASSTVPQQPTVNDLLTLDDTWMSAGTNSCFSNTKSSQPVTSENCSRVGGIFEMRQGDSDSERQSSELGQNFPGTGQPPNASSISNVPQQITSWLGRQKLPHWRLRKHSASQSSLPTATESSAAETTGNQPNTTEFSKSYGEVKGNSFLKRYQKRGLKSSTDLTQTAKRNSSQFQVVDPLIEFGPPPPLPSSEPPLLGANPPNNPMNSFPEFGGIPAALNLSSTVQPSHNNSNSFSANEGGGGAVRRWSTDSSTSDDESNAEFQTSKIRQLQIKPLNESQQPKLNVSLDELRSAIGQIAIQKSSTFENDPWSGDAEVFSHSQGPIRPSLTGDSHFRRKLVYDFDPSPCDGSQSASIFSTAGTIARARPRSHTPLLLAPKQFTGSEQTAANPIAAFNSTPVAGPLQGNPPFAQFTTLQPVVDAKVPVAMAINEFLHCWIREDTSVRPEVRVFGTVLLSLPISALPTLQSMADNTPLKFTVRGVRQIKSLVPNQFFAISNCPQVADASTQFSIERAKLCKFLQEQREKCPQASFHNADLMRYELPDKPELALPLVLKSSWRKLDDCHVEIRIEYSLGGGGELVKGPLQNVNFTTKLTEGTTTTTNSANGTQFALVHSEPKARLDNSGNIVWEFLELSRDRTPSGTLKAVAKHPAEWAMKPANTFVQFQVPDTNISGAEIRLESNDSSNYVLSVFRRKLISGKYFCEPGTLDN